MTSSTVREAVEAILDADEIGYSLNLTRLVDGEHTYTLTMQGREPVEFSDIDDAYEHIRQVKRQIRADAILAVLAAQEATR